MSISLFSLSGQIDPEALVPAGWSYSRLDQTCDIFGGGRLRLTKEKHYQSSGVLAYSAAGPDGFVENAEIKGKDGVVLSAIGANCGRCFYASGEWTTLANVQAIIPKVSLDAKYLFFYVNREGYWDRSGSAQPFIKPSSIRSSWVAYPTTKREQTKIAEILSTVDRAIEQTEALIAKQQRIKSGLMQNLLTRGIDEHGNRRSEQTHQFKDSPLGRIPEEWEVERLDDLLVEKQYGISTSLSEEPIGIPVLRMNNLVNGEVDFTDLKYSERKDAQNLTLDDGDVLFNRTNSIDYVGRTGIYRHADRTVSFASYLVRLVSDSVKLHPEYLNLWLNDCANQIRVKQFATIGVQQANVNPTNLGTLSIALPRAIIEQKQIIEAISTVTNNIRAINQNLNKLRSLKTALMQDLLTGQKRVTGLLGSEI
jgi:type I restriction enzyme S subunit